MDYMLSTAAEVSGTDLLVLEDFPVPGNPLGARGAGEGA
jgi:carbon-monoxide dehydrogenase large subunit